MQKRLSFLSAYKKTVMFSAVCLFLSLGLLLLARQEEGFAQWYSIRVYPVFPATVGRLFSLWNHSFFEAGLLFALVACIALVGMALRALLFKDSFPKNFLTAGLRAAICVIAGLVLIYTLTCGVNYHRDSIGTVLKLPGEEVTRDKLVRLSFLLADELTELTADPGWDYRLLAMGDAESMEAEAIRAMEGLGRREPSLSGYYPRPKPVWSSRALSRFGIEGFFSPFTLEANYSNDMTPFLIPYTICHELAHLKGYMKEEDAGFIAYLACRDSDSMVLRYSGIFRALIFTLEELNEKAGRDEFRQIYQRLPQPVKYQLSYIKAQNQQVGETYQVIAETVNNAYLKANAQPGTASYGRVVDLLLADYAEQLSGENLL